MSIEDPDERSFYEIEAANQNWSEPELKRRVDSCLFELLALSRKKGEVRKLAADVQIVIHPLKMLKEPYVKKHLEWTHDQT